MTKEEKIQILRETIDTKYDIVLALQKLQSTTGIEVGVRRGGNLKRIRKRHLFSHRKRIQYESNSSLFSKNGERIRDRSRINYTVSA